MATSPVAIELKRTAFIEEVMTNHFNQCLLFKTASDQVSLAAKVIKSKLQSRRRCVTATDEQLEQQKQLDLLSKNTKRNSQYKTKARTILFHLIGDIEKCELNYLNLPYSDLNQLPRYDFPCQNQLKANERQGITNEMLYEVYDKWVQTDPKRHIYDVYLNPDTTGRPLEDDEDDDQEDEKPSRNKPTLYWTLEMAQLIEQYGQQIVSYLYKKYETTAIKERSDYMNRKQVTQAPDSLVVVKEDEIVTKLMIQLICELDHVTVIKYLMDLTSIPDKEWAWHPLQMFVKALVNILYAPGDGIVNNLEGLRGTNDLIKGNSTNLLKILLDRATYLKYRKYTPKVINDDNDHIPYDISMFPKVSRFIQQVYCMQVDGKIELYKNTSHPIDTKTQQTCTLETIDIANGSGTIFDVIGMPGISFDNLRAMTWLQRLTQVEAFLKTTNMVQFTTVLPKLMRINRLQILYDAFAVSDKCFLLIRTASLGLGSFFVKNCKSVDRQRSKRTKRQRKIQREDLKLISNRDRNRHVVVTEEVEDDTGLVQPPLYNKDGPKFSSETQLRAPTEYTTFTENPSQLLATISSEAAPEISWNKQSISEEQLEQLRQLVGNNYWS